MSDSLISGQPLYLLYSYVKRGPPGPAARVARRLRHARDREREVAGHGEAAHQRAAGPLRFGEQESDASGPRDTAAAAAPCSSCLRVKTCLVSRLFAVHPSDFTRADSATVPPPDSARALRGVC